MKGNKDLTPSGRTKKFREQEASIRKSAIAKLEGAKAFLEGKIKDTERRISTPPPPENDDGLRRESNLIAAIRAMRPEDRAKLKADDDELAGAILRNHYLAAGMTHSEQDAFRLTWRSKKFPADAEQLTLLNRALGHIDRAIPIFSDYVEENAKGLAGGFRVLRE